MDGRGWPSADGQEEHPRQREGRVQLAEAGGSLQAWRKPERMKCEDGPLGWGGCRGRGAARPPSGCGSGSRFWTLFLRAMGSHGRIVSRRDCGEISAPTPCLFLFYRTEPPRPS